MGVGLILESVMEWDSRTVYNTTLNQQIKCLFQTRPFFFWFVGIESDIVFTVTTKYYFKRPGSRLRSNLLRCSVWINGDEVSRWHEQTHSQVTHHMWNQAVKASGTNQSGQLHPFGRQRGVLLGDSHSFWLNTQRLTGPHLRSPTDLPRTWHAENVQSELSGINPTTNTSLINRKRSRRNTETNQRRCKASR